MYNPTIEKALENYLKPEKLEGENQYFCGKCNIKVDATKGSKFTEFPKILTLHLNRFDLDYNTFKRKKLNNKMTFPLILNMNKFLKPYEEIVKLNELDPQNNNTVKINDEKKKSISDFKAINDAGFADDFFGYYDDADEMKAKRYLQLIKKYNNTSSTYEDLPSQIKENKIIKTKTGLLYDDYIPTKGKQNLIENKPTSQTFTDKNQMIESLAELKQAQRLFDKKLSHFPIANKNIDKSTPILDFSTKDYERESYDMLGFLEPISVYDKPLITNKDSKRVEEEIIDDSDHEEEYFEEDLVDKSVNLLAEEKYVYELYSIMIHSGSAAGGHYYAYIKSFENNRWYNFNDTSITKIDQSEINNVFGEETPKCKILRNNFNKILI